MKIVILGDGKIGHTLCKQLEAEGHDIVMIDNDEKALNELSNELDVLCICGNGALKDVQLEAGVDKCNLFIACASSDELNMLCCLLAKKLGAKRTIARVRNPEYDAQLEVIKDELGLSMSLNPELVAAREISRMLVFPAATKIEVFAKGRVELVEARILKEGTMEGLALFDICRSYKIKILVCAVQRGEEVFIPSGDFELKAGDRIYLTATHAELEKFFKIIGHTNKKIKNVLLIGGGKVSYYIAKLLEKTGMNIKIIESDYEKCIELNELLPDITVIHGDGTEHELLIDEGIYHTDAMAVLTGIDEENIIVSMYAQGCGVEKIITKISRDSYAEMADKMGLDGIITPKNIIADNVVGFVRATQNSKDMNKVETLYRLIGDKIIALEFTVNEKARYADIPLKNLKIKKDVLIACIVRQRKTIIPDGNTEIKTGDSVIIVTKNKKFSDLSEMLEL